MTLCRVIIFSHNILQQWEALISLYSCAVLSSLPAKCQYYYTLRRQLWDLSSGYITWLQISIQYVNMMPLIFPFTCLPAGKCIVFLVFEKQGIQTGTLWKGVMLTPERKKRLQTLLFPCRATTRQCVLHSFILWFPHLQGLKTTFLCTSNSQNPTGFQCFHLKRSDLMWIFNTFPT